MAEFVQMTRERAAEIVAAICYRSFHAMDMGISAVPERPLDGVTLAEMLEARALVEANNNEAIAVQRDIGGKITLSVIPDDRLIAAAFALENYPSTQRVIVAQPQPHYHTMKVLLVRAIGISGLPS